MKEKKITRREAVGRLTKIIALAAGLSTTQVRRVLGLEKSTPTQKIGPVQKPLQKAPNIQNIKNVKPSNFKVKMMKVMLYDNRSVFESEFGRITPKYTVKDVHNIPERYSDFLKGFQVRPGTVICEVEWIGPGAMAQCDAGLICGTNYVSGMGAVSASCTDNGCSLCSYGCGGEMHLACPGQNCPHVSCGPSNYYNNSDAFTSEGFFNRFRTDPFVQALFKEFNVSTSQALAQEIKSMLSEHR